MYICIYVYIYIYTDHQRTWHQIVRFGLVTYQETEIAGHAHHAIAAGMDIMSIAIDTGTLAASNGIDMPLALPGQPNERSFICIWACGILTI